MAKAKKAEAPADPSSSVIVNSRPILQDPSAIAREEVKEPLLTAPVLPIETLDDKKTTKAPVKPKVAAKTAKKTEALPGDDGDTHVIQVKRLSIKPLSEAQPAEPAQATETTPPPEQSAPAVQPLVDKPAEEAPPAEPETETPPAAPEPPAESQPQAEPEIKPATEPEAKPEPAEPTSEEKPDQETAAPSEQLQKVDLEAEVKAKAAHDAAIQKLVDSKKYFLPINTVEKRRSKRFVAVGFLLSLLLLVAWADIAADAGLISVPGVKPVTHFFSN